MGTRLLPVWIIRLFFFIGLISATLFRLIIFLNRVNLVWARTAWYAGVAGYVLFFGYRYYIAWKRRKTIYSNNLLEKLESSDIDRDAKIEIEYLLNSLTKSREIINYVYIFVTSILAVVLDLILVMLKM